MEPRQASQVTKGLVIIAIGLILFAGQTELGSIHLGRFWPVVFIILGVGKILAGGRPAKALWMFFLGGIFFMHTYHVLSLRDSWPLFIVAGGLSFMFGRDEPDSSKRQSQGSEPPAASPFSDGRHRP